MALPIKQIARLLLILLLSASPALCDEPAKPEGQDQVLYKEGVEAYQKKDYSAAADKFWASINAGNSSAIPWLYMGHARMGMKDWIEADKAYRMVVKLFPNSPEAQLATQCVKNLVVQLKNMPPAAKTPPVAPPPAASAPKAATGNLMLQKINIIAPKGNHPAVSQLMIRSVQLAVQRLPARFDRLIADGGARIFIAPNILDKWPEAVNDVKNGTDIPLSQEIARCYGRDMYIYERPATEKGGTALGAARSSDTIQWVTLNQLCHAIDDCSGTYSKDPKVVAIYTEEKEGVFDDMKGELAEYIGEGGCSETCAELLTGMFGGQGEHTTKVFAHFPRTRDWLKAKLKL